MQAWRVKVSENICVSGRENATCWHFEGSLLIANNGVAKKCTACSLFPCLYWLLGFKSRNILIGSVRSKGLQNSNSSFSRLTWYKPYKRVFVFCKKRWKVNYLYFTIQYSIECIELSYRFFRFDALFVSDIFGFQ